MTNELGPRSAKFMQFDFKDKYDALTVTFGTFVVPLMFLVNTKLHAVRERVPGREKSATCPTSKAPISAVFHSLWLILGRAIFSWNGLEAWMLFFGSRARRTLTLKRR